MSGSKTVVNCASGGEMAVEATLKVPFVTHTASAATYRCCLAREMAVSAHSFLSINTFISHPLDHVLIFPCFSC